MAHNLSGPLNANGNEIQNMRFHNLGGAPSSPTPGRVYYNTTDNNLYIYNGTAWQYLMTGAQALLLRLDQFAAPTAAINLNGQRITNQADPTAPQDSATKNYVDALLQGIKWKDAVRVATTSTLTLSGIQTVDGVTLVAGDRVAMMNNAATAGIYVAASGAWTRSLDADAGTEVLGMAFFVSEGTANGNKIFNMTTDGPITLGTTVLVFSQIGAGTSYAGGTGINIAGSTISIDTSVTARRGTALIGNGSLTSITVTHGFGTKAVTVGLRKVSTDEHWIPDVTSSTVNAVTLSFATAPASNEFEVVIVG